MAAWTGTTDAKWPPARTTRREMAAWTRTTDAKCRRARTTRREMAARDPLPREGDQLKESLSADSASGAALAAR